GAVAARGRRGLDEEAVVPELAAGGDAAQRVAAADRLAEDEDVRGDVVPVRREHGAEAAEAGDRLVVDEQPPAAAAELAERPQEVALGGEVAGGAEDGLDDHRGHAALEPGRVLVERV